METKVSLIVKGKKQYVKIQEKGQRAKTYLYDGKTMLATYKRMYESEKKYKEHKNLREYKLELKNLRKQAREIQKLPSITGYIKSGKTTAKMMQAHRMTEKSAKTLYRQLLTPVINLKGIAKRKLLDIMTEEQNVKKMRLNLETTAYIKDAQGNTLGTISKVGSTPKEAKRDIISKSDGAMRIGQQTSVDSKSPFRMHIKNLKQKGYNYEHGMTGIIHHIELEVTFRRA